MGIRFWRGGLLLGGGAGGAERVPHGEHLAVLVGQRSTSRSHLHCFCGAGNRVLRHARYSNFIFFAIGLTYMFSASGQCGIRLDAAGEDGRRDCIPDAVDVERIAETFICHQ